MSLKSSTSSYLDNKQIGSSPPMAHKLALKSILSPRKDESLNIPLRNIHRKDVKSWSIEDVGIWLGAFDLHDSKEFFVENEISGPELLTLTDEDLVSIGITKLGPRKKILRKIEELNMSRSQSTQNSPTVSDGAVGIGNILVKLNFEGEIRKQKFKLTDGVKEVRKAVKKLFDNELSVRNYTKDMQIPLQIKYTDEDNDVITVDSDDSVQVAFSFAIRNKTTLTFAIMAPARNSVLRASSSSPALTMYSMFEEMVDPVIVIDHLGVMHYVNNATEQLTGFDSRNLKGRNVNILMTANDREHHDTYIKNFVASGRPKIIGIGKDVVLQRKDSTLVPVHLEVSARVLDGKPFFIGLFKKFREQPQVKSLLQREREALDQLSIPGVISDSNGVILCINKATEKFFGHNLSDSVGKNVKIFMTDRHAEKHDAYLQKYAQTGESKLIGIGRRVTTRHKDGTLNQAVLSLAEKKENGNVYYIAVFKEKEFKRVG